jgi:hypothetical protein
MTNLPTKEVITNPETITLLGEDKPIKNPFGGSVTLMIPTYVERLEIAQHIAGKEKEGKEGIDAAKRMISSVKERVKNVDLIYGGEAITDFDELSYYEEGAALINELGAMLTKGARLGKPTK